MISAHDIEAGLRQQGIWCGEFGSSFTQMLCAKLADDFRDGGIVAKILEGWPTDPIKDALALRLTGALHHMVLLDLDGPLANVFPKSATHWDMDQAWPVARRHLEQRQDWVRDFIKSPPQTNEVRRSVGLYPGLCVAASNFDGPVDLLELGASAGLNLSMDEFSYDTGVWTAGDPSRADVIIDTQWSGPAPDIGNGLQIRHRSGCDQNPLDVTNPDHARLLNAYVWPDQPERLARLRGAIKLATQRHLVPERADAADWLHKELQERKADALTIVYHSIFLIYPDEATRNRIHDLMEAAGAMATEQNPLAWLRFEWPGILGLPATNTIDAALELIQWPGGKRTLLATIDSHGRWVNWY